MAKARVRAHRGRGRGAKRKSKSPGKPPSAQPELNTTQPYPGDQSENLDTGYKSPGLSLATLHLARPASAPELETGELSATMPSPKRNRIPAGLTTKIKPSRGGANSARLLTSGPLSFTNGPIRTEGKASPARPQLPIGETCTRALAKRNANVSDQIEARLAPEKRSADQIKEAERERRRHTETAVGSWLAEKQRQDDAKKAARKAKAEKDKLKSEAFMTVMNQRSDNAFKRWEKSKREQALRAKMRGTGKAGPVTIEEFLCAWRRLGHGGHDLLHDFHHLLLLLDPSGKINPDKFHGILTQVDIQIKVDSAIVQIESEELAKHSEEKRKLTQDEVEKARTAKVQLRIGAMIIKTISPNRQAFGRSLTSIRSMFEAMDTDGNGLIDKIEFKDGIKRLDLGINSTQQIELLKAFDEDGSGEIDYAEFENFLIRCKAAEERDKPRLPAAKFDVAWAIVEQCNDDLDEARGLFEDALANVVATRQHRNAKAGIARLTAAQLKERVVANVSRGSPFGKLQLSERKDVVKVFDQLFKVLERQGDARKKGAIALDEVDMFVFTVEQRHLELARNAAMGAAERKLNDARYKLAKVVLKNSELQNYTFAGLVKHLNRLVRAPLENEGNAQTAGRPLKSETFKKLLRGAGIGLTIIQYEEITRLFDPAETGQVMFDDFARYMNYASERYCRDIEWKEDPRSSLVDSLLRALPEETVLLVLEQLHFQLQVDQIHRLRPMYMWPGARQRAGSMSGGDSGSRRESFVEAMLSRRGSVVGSVGVGAADEGSEKPVEYAADFDVTWGGMTMPPGAPGSRNEKYLIEKRAEPDRPRG